MDQAKKFKTIDEYILDFPESTQVILLKIRTTIKENAPDSREAISYGIPTFKLNGNLVHFAGYKYHIGFYPGSEAIEVFRDKLTGYETSKGTIRFPIDKPIPYDLIKEIVKFRVIKNTPKLDK